MAEKPTPDPRAGKMAPRWLAEMRNGKAGGAHVSKPNGFYVNYKNFAVVHVARGNDRLVVSFDNLSSVNDDSLEREAWGDKFYAEQGWSSLGVLSFDANWYRDETLFDYMEGLRNSGFFKQFKHVVFTGTSMGGYAACAFCSLSPGSTVLAYSPQSTLAKDLVPWEKRFNRGRQQDWSGRYRDCTQLTSEASRVYLCYDPYMAGDKGHADRYFGDNIVHLHSNYVGHKTVVFFRRAGILKNITKLCITNKMTKAIFDDLYRSRRKLPWYYFGLMDMALERGHLGLSQRIIDVSVKASGNANMANTLIKRRDAFQKDQEKQLKKEARKK